jgi:hypothetical protein
MLDLVRMSLPFRVVGMSPTLCCSASGEQLSELGSSEDNDSSLGFQTGLSANFGSAPPLEVANTGPATRVRVEGIACHKVPALTR